MSLQMTNATLPRSTEVLISDAIDSLQRGDSNSAKLYLSQANDQLALLNGNNQTRSDEITLAGETIQNTTGIVQENETSSGKRVLRCLAGGALVGLLAPELLTQIRQLGPAFFAIISYSCDY
jgi:hypothetical protein